MIHGNCTTAERQMTIGLDLGSKWSELFALAADGEILAQERVATTRSAMKKRFKDFEPARVVIETGAVSLWVKELLESCGHEVIVANPRQIALIYGNRKKTDKADAENLARLGRLDPTLLHPVQLRGSDAQEDLVLMRTRDLLVSQRTELINHTRSLCRGFGSPLRSCDAAYFHRKVKDQIPAPLAPALEPALQQIENLSGQIRDFDKLLERLAKEKYHETENLMQIPGVGVLTAMAYVLTLGDPKRFNKSRQVGAYVGLVPRLDNSSDHNPQLRITKAGDTYLRRLLVQAAHYILGPHGQDCDLRQHGRRICPEDGNKGAKKRAVIAVARKLAVLLHHLWVTGDTYDPFYNSKRRSRMKTETKTKMKTKSA